MLNLNVIDVNSQEINENDPDFKKTLEIIQKAYEVDRIKFEYEIKNGELYVTKLKNVIHLKKFIVNSSSKVILIFQ